MATLVVGAFSAGVLVATAFRAEAVAADLTVAVALEVRDDGCLDDAALDEGALVPGGADLVAAACDLPCALPTAFAVALAVTVALAVAFPPV